MSLRGCRFVANRGCSGGSGQYTNKDKYGGIVALLGACGGSRVENCAFIANSDTFSLASGNIPTHSSCYGGALVFRLTDSETAATVRNCTFAYNLSDTLSSPAGVSVVNGDVKVTGCIFVGNRVGRQCIVAPDVSFANDAKGEVSYSLFTCAKDALDTRVTVTNTTGTVDVKADTLAFGDPLLVKALDESAIFAVSSGLTTFKLDAATLAELFTANIHLRGGSGYVDETTGETVKDWTRRRYGNSPAIDAGDPDVPFPHEARPRGQRINLGFYGNTEWATMSGGGTMLLVR